MASSGDIGRHANMICDKTTRISQRAFFQTFPRLTSLKLKTLQYINGQAFSSNALFPRRPPTYRPRHTPPSFSRKKDTTHTLRRTGFVLCSQYIPFILTKITTSAPKPSSCSHLSDIYIYSIHLYARLVVIALLSFLARHFFGFLVSFGALHI